MKDAIELLGQAERLLAQVSIARSNAVDDDTLVAITARAEAVGRRLDGIGVFAASEIENRSGRELGETGLSRRYGYQRASHLIEGVALVSAADAVRRIRLGALVSARWSIDGRALDPPFPAVSEALAEGRIAVESAAHIVRSLGEAVPRCAVDDVVAAEAALVHEALSASADLIRDQARAWRDHLDTDGAEPRGDLQYAKRTFRLGREREDGMTPFAGLADPVSAGILRAGINAFRSKVLMADGRVAGSGSAEGTADEASPGDPAGVSAEDARTFTSPDAETAGSELSETRTTGQRDFDILLAILESGIHADHTVRTGGRASVIATVMLDDLLDRTGVGWLDDVRESISVAQIDQLACDSGIEIAVTGSNGALLALTSRQEFFTAPQRRAMAARDGAGCVWSNCHSPASWADAHHVIERREGGRTEVSNGVVLCPPHHRMLHTSRFQLRMIRGRPHMLAPPSIDPEQRWRSVGNPRAGLAQTAAAHRPDADADGRTRR